MSRRRALLLLLGVVAFLLAGASVPHTHAGIAPGIWNADHDLSLMAAFGNHACPLDAVPIVALVLALTATLTPTAVEAASVPRSRFGSRSPPRF